MIETVVLEVLTKVTNIERTQQNVVVGQRLAAALGQTRRFEQNGVVVELTPQAVLQGKVFLGYKVLLHSKGKAWTSVAQGSFQASASGTTQLLVADKHFGNFIDLSVKTSSETENGGSRGGFLPEGGRSERSLAPLQKHKKNVRASGLGPA